MTLFWIRCSDMVSRNNKININTENLSNIFRKSVDRVTCQVVLLGSWSSRSLHRIYKAFTLQGSKKATNQYGCKGTPWIQWLKLKESHKVALENESRLDSWFLAAGLLGRVLSPFDGSPCAEQPDSKKHKTTTIYHPGGLLVVGLVVCIKVCFSTGI